MKPLQALALLVALALLAGEPYRGILAGAAWTDWIDDVAAALLLATAALAMARPSVRRQAFLAGSWGFATALMFGNFTAKLQGDDPAALLALLALGWLAGLAGLVATILLANDPREV